MKLLTLIYTIFFIVLAMPQLSFSRANINNQYFSDISRYRPYRASATNLDLHGYAFQFDGGSWQSSGNFNDAGDNVSFTNDQLYSSFDANFSGQYSFTKSFELRAGLRFRQNKSQTFDNLDVKEVSGLESWTLGMQWMFPRKTKWFYALQGYYRGTPYTNSEPVDGNLTDELVLGDSGTEFGLSFHFGYERKLTHVYAGSIGLRAPGEQLSEEITYHFETAWIFARSALIVGASGVQSLGRDPFTDNLEFRPDFDDAPTNLFNSINRSYFEPYLRFNYSLSKGATVGLSYARVLWGQSWDSGQRIGLHIDLTSAGKSVNDLVFDKFKDYEAEAGVIKVSPRERFVKVDRGLSGEVRKGMRFDIYQFDYLGGNVLVATGFVYEVSADTAIIRIRKKYRNIPIKVGFVARGN